jgi:mannose-1-phosphate guanylyltransferase
MNKGAIATIALTEVDRPQEFGIVGLDDDQRIVRFKEKPEPNEVFSNLINAGIYVLQSQVLDYIPESEKYDFSRNVFPSLLSDGEPLFGSRLAGYWKDIGRPSDLLEANLSMAAMKGGAVKAEGVAISGRVFATAFSAKGATLEGPLYLGEAVIIGERTKLASSIIGKGTVIGKGVEVSGSLLMENCVLEDSCSVTGSLMGERCKVGRGVSLTNCVIGDGAVLKGPTVLEDESVV